MSNAIEPMFAAVAGGIVAWTTTSLYWRQKTYRMEDLCRLKKWRDYHAEKAVEFAGHTSTMRRYEIEAQVYQEAIEREEKNLKSVLKTFWGVGAFIPDIEREASERWMAEQAQ